MFSRIFSDTLSLMSALFRANALAFFLINYDPYPHPQNCGHPLWTVFGPEISLPPKLYIEWVKSGLWLLIGYSHVIFSFVGCQLTWFTQTLNPIIQTCWLFLQLQSNLVMRNFLVILKLFLNAKYSLSLWSKLTIGHRIWFLSTNLVLIKTFLTT